MTHLFKSRPGWGLPSARYARLGQAPSGFTEGMLHYRFFIEFLTQPGDVVLDPFAGSNMTGSVAEQLGRKWVAIERSEEYLRDSQLRFQDNEPAPVDKSDKPLQKLLFRGA